MKDIGRNEKSWLGVVLTQLPACKPQSKWTYQRSSTLTSWKYRCATQSGSSQKQTLGHPLQVCILHSLVFTCPTSCWRWRLKHVSRQNYVTESGTGIYPTLFWFYAVLPGIMVVEAQHQLFLQGQVLLTPRLLQNFPWNPSASWHADRWQLCNRVVTIGFEEPALVSSTLGHRISDSMWQNPYQYHAIFQLPCCYNATNHRNLTLHLMI